jgi:AcrR family transcriptional regulator
MREAAVVLVNERGFGALSFRALAEELDVTRTAPLYYFGTTVGLIAAIAAYGLDELIVQLRRVRESGEDSLKGLALAYGKFALMNPHLYRAMHSPELWQATTDDEMGTRRANQGATEKAETWIQRAADLRRDAFRVFQLTVDGAIGGGLIREEPRGQKGASAHLMTTIVDGFLFHHFEERVGVGSSMKRLLTDLEFLLDRALTGLYRIGP